MAGSALALILFASLAAPLVECDEPANEPPFPDFFHRTNRMRIVSELFYPDGGYKTAEELIDLYTLKAAYIETRDNVRSIRLVDVHGRSIYDYKPFTCERSEYSGNSDGIRLQGISAILWSLIQSPSKRYSRTPGRTAYDSDGSERIGHKWALENDGITTHIFFSESARVTDEADQTPELVLDSIIQYEGSSRNLTINILSVEYELPDEAYQNEFQLPLIHGCRRDAATLNTEMQQKFDIIAVDLINRHHFKATARAINFAVSKPTSTESNFIELAFSQPRDANHNISPVRMHMIRQQDPQKDIKTVVDHYLNVKYETNMTDGTCTMSNLGTMNSPQRTNPTILQFSDELTLNINAKVLESMLYNVTKESFMKLEQRGNSTQYAYFADTQIGLFGPRSTVRVVRRFFFGTNGRSKLDSFAIWIFESEGEIREVYDFNIIETKSLASDTNSAQAFDISRECYLNKEEALEGRDYAWFELDYSLPSEQVDSVRGKIEEFKNTLYRQIRTNLDLSYALIPKMEVIFSGNSDGFTIKMLVLDSLPLHLIYGQLESLSLDPALVQATEVVASLHDCSEFCWKNRCMGMTFSRVDHTCSLAFSGVDFIRHLKQNQNTDTYWIPKGNNPHLLPRLQRQIDALRSNNQDISKILGFHELNRAHITGNLHEFGGLHSKVDLNGQVVDLVPVSVRVGSEPDRTNDSEPEKMIFEDRDEA